MKAVIQNYRSGELLVDDIPVPALKPGGILLITEIMFDPHYQSRTAILQLASTAGFREIAFWGNRFTFTMHLEKPR